LANNVSCLFLFMNWRRANTVRTVGFFKGSTEVPHFLWRCRHWSRNVGLLLANSKFHLAHCQPNTRFYGACRNYANFLYLILILCRFRITRCNRQADLHSALFNFTPLVISWNWHKKQLILSNQHKLTLAAINKLLHYEIIGAPQKLKNQSRPLVMPGSVNSFKFLKFISW